MKNPRNSTFALLEADGIGLSHFKDGLADLGHVTTFSSPFELYRFAQDHHIDVVITSGGLNSASGMSFMDTLREKNTGLIFIFFLRKLDEVTVRQAYQSKVSEVFDASFSGEEIKKRVKYLISKRGREPMSWPGPLQKGKLKLPLFKRVFDLLFSGFLLLCLSPFLALIALLIRLESPGPIIYYAPRVGTGYRIFRFYKFRSMRLNADQQLKNMKHLNQYDLDTEQDTGGVSEKCQYCQQRNLVCHSKLFADGREFCENLYQQIEAQEAGSTFIKIKNDPRITRVGRFIRNTSIDELPQLFNVLIGDMSIVGNRPLPLYEAEKLTTDQFAERFHAPAGITGLWQISKRGKGKMTEEERIALDNQYARSYSLWLDLQILFKTFFALLQKENV